LFGLFVFACLSLSSEKNKYMSLFNTNKNKDKKKGTVTTGKPGLPSSKGKSNSKAAAKQTRITGRAQRGS